MIKKLFGFLVTVFAKFVTYREYAETVLKIADMFFERIVGFVGELVEIEQVHIDSLKESGANDMEIKEAKAMAALSVDLNTAAMFSGSPTFVPGFVRRSIRDAWAYLVNYKPNEIDQRDPRAKEHGFFRQHNQNEMQDIVDNGLNKGWIN